MFSPTARRGWLVNAWIFCAFSVFSAIYASRDSELYIIPAVLIFSCWMACGLDRLAQAAQTRHSHGALILFALALGATLARVPVTLPGVDASRDSRAEAFIDGFNRQAPPHALIIASQDWQVFSLWYARFALGQRPDTIILADGLLGYDWYRASLAHTYPGLGLPANQTLAPFDIINANPGRPFCILNGETFTCP